MQAGWRDYDQAEAIVGNRRLPDPETLHAPGHILVDPVSRKVFVVDSGYHRVLRYPSTAALQDGTPAEAAFGQPDLYTAQPRTTQSSLWRPEAATIDSSGRLWVLDSGNYRVLRWDNAATVGTGTAAVQVLGQPDFTSRQNGGDGRLTQPRAIAVDGAGRLWVSDWMGRRVLRYDAAASKPNGGQPNGVLGQPDMASSNVGLRTARDFSTITDLAVDAQGRLWMADSDNGRVLRFDNPAAGNYLPADGVLGQMDFVSRSQDFSASIGRFLSSLTVGSDGTLHVSDSGMQRVLRWKNAATRTNGSPADGVLGRLGFLQSSDYPGMPGYINVPSGVAADPDGGVWVIDGGEERALLWNSIHSQTNGAAADRILGFTAEVPVYRRQVARDTISPVQALEDPKTGKFYVAESVRVLRYASRLAAENGAAPEAALGKQLITMGASGTPSDINLTSTGGLALDGDGRLWVSDPNANRVVAFDTPATSPTGTKMSRVLGQTLFTEGVAGLTARALRGPRALAFDAAGGLWVADAGNHRVVRFDSPAAKGNGGAADAVLGQPDFTTAEAGTEAWRLRSPRGVAVDAAGRLWIADTERNRVVMHESPRAAVPTAAPKLELGGLASVGPAGMSSPNSVVVTRGGRLWVSDSGFTRLLRFEAAASRTNRAPADGVLGAPNLDRGLILGRSLEHFSTPQGLSLDVNENLWMADTFNHRLLRFAPEESAVIREVSTVPGKIRMQFETTAAGVFIVQSSTDLRTWVDEQSYKLGAGAKPLFERASDGTARFLRVFEP